MSKVKQSLEEAKTFASAEAQQQEAQQPPAEQQPPEPAAVSPTNSERGAVAVVTPRAAPLTAAENRAQYVAEKEKTVVDDAETADPIVYACERAQHNADLKTAAADLERRFVALCDADTAAVDALREAQEALRGQAERALQRAGREVQEPERPPLPLEALRERFQLRTDVARAAFMNEHAAAVAERAARAPVTLNAAPDVKKGRPRGVFFDALEPLAATALGDGPLVASLLQPLKVAAHTDPLAPLADELFEGRRELAAISAALVKVVDARDAAAQGGDIEAAERLSWEEIDGRCDHTRAVQARLANVYAASSDVAEFRAEADRLTAEAQARLAAHTTANDDALAGVVADAEALKAAAAEELEAAFQRDEAHAAALRESDETLRGVAARRAAVWAQIAELLGEGRRLAHAHSEAAAHRLQLVSERAAAKAEEDRLQTSLEQATLLLEGSRDFCSATAETLRVFRTFVSAQATAIDAKGLEEQLLDVRVQEQLGYCEAYRGFRRAAGELLHKKETRAAALQRLQRSLQLQIQEALNTLDPNKARYEEELVGVRADAEATQRLVAMLGEHVDRQRAMWAPVETQLEDARADFAPPDLEVEALLCARKAAAIESARRFLGKEQETVDKEQVRLRKLKSSTVVAVEESDKRREQVRALAAQTSPPRAIAPPASAATEVQPGRTRDADGGTPTGSAPTPGAHGSRPQSGDSQKA